MKKIAPVLFFAALLCALAACPGPMLDSSITVSGTVTITRNGVPWNSDNFSPYGYNRVVGPPTDRPIIYAHSSGNWLSGGWAGNASVYYQPDGDDYRNGTYQWTLKIPAGKLPCSVYFDVRCEMYDVVSGLPTARKEFWIEDEITIVDIGLINFDVVRLSGNLPITINNEPLDDYAVGQMNVFIPQEEVYPPVYISPNGDWSLCIARPDSEIPLEFQVEVRQNGGFLRKMLNTGNAVTVYDTDKEVVFPDYPSVNFEAFNLSGIIEVVSPGTGESRYYSIKFFREGAEFTGGDYGDYGPQDYLLSDTDTGWSASGLKEWKTTIPVLELPHELLYSFLFHKGPDVYRGHSSVIIANDTDLSNIDLGVFTFE